MEVEIVLQVSSELQLELGLDLELNTEDVAAAEAAVAAHIDGSLTCSCCNQVLTDKVSLHLHQISQHSVSELSLAILSMRGLDVKSGLGVTESQNLCCEDDDSESTASAHSPFTCGFIDDFRVNSQNMVGDIDLLNSSEKDVKINNNNKKFISSMPVPQFSSNTTRKTSHESNINGSQGRRGHQQQAPSFQAYRNVAWEVDRNSSEITALTLANRKRKSRPKRVKSNNPKGTNKFPAGATDQVIDLTSKTSSKSSRPSTLVNKDPRSRLGSNTGIEERKFSCDICGRRYKKKSHLGRHTRMHSGVRPFPCSMCDKRFAVRSILKQHLRVHTGERPFKCSFCLQRFPQKSGLVTHMMLHTGKPYKCDCCSKSFVSNHKLVVHKRAHEEQSGRLPSLGPHSCPTCATRFFTTSALWEHGKVHSSAATLDTSSLSGLSGLSGLSLTTPKSSDNSINSKVSAAAPAECSVSEHLTGILEFTQDISLERDDGKKSDSARIISRSSLKNVNGNIGGRTASMPVEADVNTHNSQEVTASQALLTLMDSNAEFHGDRNESLESEGEFSEGQLNTSEFEFCGLKSSIELKEECFDFEDEDLDEYSNCESENKVEMILS